MLGIERESTRSLSVENWLWKRLWTCRKTDFEINEYSKLDRTQCYVRAAFIIYVICACGPGSSVSIATVYGLDGPGIETRWGRDFPHLSRQTLGPTQPPVQWVPGLSWG